MTSGRVEIFGVTKPFSDFKEVREKLLGSACPLEHLSVLRCVDVRHDKPKFDKEGRRRIIARYEG